MSNNHQDFEADWWGSCANTYGEESKQIVYARLMNLSPQNLDGHWPVYDIDGGSVLDIGGGPSSMLLKTINAGHRTVVDPCPYPDWVAARYEAEGIEYIRSAGESFISPARYDECWIYNVLQHVEDPTEVIAVARRNADRIRIFEWIDIPAHPGHPHELHKTMLDDLLSVEGNVVDLNERGCVGRAYYFAEAKG